MRDMCKMKKRVMIMAGIAAGACLMMGSVLPVNASAGDGLYSAMSSIYGLSGGSSGSSTASSVINNISGSSGGGASMPGNRKVITYYPIYNVQQQQQLSASQQAAGIIRQTYDVSGNSVFSGDVSGNTAISNQYNQWTKALTPDIAALESDPIGPTVNTVSLSESYHEDYKVYAEEFGDSYTIYSNISNGTIVNHYVMFDIPSGVMARMTRDGVSVGISNKTKIEAEGTYNVQFFYAEQGSENVPAWQQEINSARFTFRIQYTAGLDGEPLEWDDQSELESFADLVNEDENTDEKADEPASEATPTPEPATADTSSKSGPESRIATSFDSKSGYYKIDLLTGDSFYSSVPNGMVTNESVIFQADDDIELQLYKDGEEVTYSSGDFITDKGNYTLIPVKDDVSYENFYRGNRPMLRFRILTGSTSDLSTFSAPEGMIIEAVRLDYEDITDTAMATYKVAYMPTDGNYEVDLRDDSGRTTVNIVRDSVPPIVEIATAPNEAKITYVSDDIKRVVLMRGDTVISEENMINNVTEPGRYHLIVKDDAGNTTEKDFIVKYRINVAAILAILAVAAIGVAVFLYMRKVRTTVRVR